MNMIQEEKELLFKDLCSRLPYGVIVDIKYNKEHGSSDRLRICNEGSLTLNTDLIGLYIEEEIYLKPYLRSMYSMTDKEKKEYKNYFNSILGKLIGFQGRIIWALDWLNKYHFDYRGLIRKNLAIEAPEGMYD